MKNYQASQKAARYCLSVSVFFILLGFLFLVPDKVGICEQEMYRTCIDKLGDNIGQPLFLGSLALSLVFLLLRFLPPQYFSAWLKFGTWYIPLAAIAIIWAPVSGGDLFSFDKESVTWFFSGLYVIVCVVIILIKFVAGRMRGLPPPLIKGDWGGFYSD